jgi:hypothetical protein
MSWEGEFTSWQKKKEGVIYDYVDLDVPVLARMYERRIKGYRSIGYEIEDEHSWIAAVILFPLCENRAESRIWSHINRIFSPALLYQIKPPKEGRSPPWAGGGPVAFKRSLLNNRGCERFEKKFNNGGNNILEGLRSVDQLGLPDETLPLNIFVPILAERRVE